MRARIVLLLLTATAPFLPHQAFAQSDIEPADARAVIHEQGSLAKVQDMSFGDISPPSSAGTVVLSPSATATCNTTGGLIHSGECQAATFVGDVSFLFILRITRPAGNQILLNGPAGATMRLNNFTFGAGSSMLNLGSTATEQRYLVLTGNGYFMIHVGGTLNVAANQRPGVYSGSFQLLFNYN